MDIRVSGHQIDTGTALQEHAAVRLNGIIDKYFSRAMSSQVTFGKAPASAYGCMASMPRKAVKHAGTGQEQLTHVGRLPRAH